MKNSNEELLILAKCLKNYVVGAEGNVSEKVDGGFVIKASGTTLKYLSYKDLIKCDFEGKQINNFDKKPSIETGFHSFLLQKPNINFVAHTHPTNTLKILCSNIELISEFANKRMFPDQVVFNGEKSCIVPYAHPGTELCKNVKHSVDEFMEKNKYLPKLILLVNHGIICAGSTIKECLIATEMCEKSAEIFIGAKSISKCTFISNDEIEQVKVDTNEIYRNNIWTKK
jgi:ribulose-5-phosphate 4-epimerase/fuculose-1-phosphate aldolase